MRVGAERAPTDRQEHRVGVDGYDGRAGKPLQDSCAQRPRAAAEVEHAWFGTRKGRERIDDGAEAFFAVGDMALLLRIPPGEPARPVDGSGVLGHGCKGTEPGVPPVA